MRARRIEHLLGDISANNMHSAQSGEEFEGSTEEYTKCVLVNEQLRFNKIAYSYSALLVQTIAAADIHHSFAVQSLEQLLQRVIVAVRLHRILVLHLEIAINQGIEAHLAAFPRLSTTFARSTL